MEMRAYGPTGGEGGELDLFLKFKDLLQPNFDHLETKIDATFHKEASRVLKWLAVGLLGSIGTVAGTVWYAGQRYGHLQDAVETQLPKQIDALRSSNDELKQNIENLRQAVNKLNELPAATSRPGAEVVQPTPH